MKRILVLTAVLLAALLAGTARAVAPPVTIGCSGGTTTIALSGNAAIVTVKWTCTGETEYANIHYSNGSTFNGVNSASLNLTAGQCVSASADIYASVDGYEGTQTTGQVCAPSDGGGGSGGGGGGTGGGGSPPADMNTPLYDNGYTLTTSLDQNGPVRVLSGVNGTPYNCLYHWKYRVYQANFTSIVGGLNFKAAYGVCYQPGVKVFYATAWSATTGSGVTSLFSWLNYNDNGFPQVIALQTKAIFNWQGSAAICFTHWGCGATRHPALTITWDAASNRESSNESVG